MRVRAGVLSEEPLRPLSVEQALKAHRPPVICNGAIGRRPRHGTVGPCPVHNEFCTRTHMVVFVSLGMVPLVVSKKVLANV